MAIDEIVPSYQVSSDGLALPKGLPIESYYSGLEYKPQKDDVFVVTYPECGSTLCQYILYLLKNQGHHIPKAKRLGSFVPQLEAVGADVVKKLDPPRIIMSHLPRHLIPYSPSAKYIYIARNPIDCLLSLYKHTRESSHLYNFHEGSLDTFFNLFVNGETDFGDYFDHVLSWYQHCNDSNLLFLVYEDLSTYFSDHVETIAEFLGGVFKESADSKQIMKDTLRMAGCQGLDIQSASPGYDETENGDATVLGKKIADLKKYFSEEQIVRLRERVEDKFGGYALSELWDHANCH